MTSEVTAVEELLDRYTDLDYDFSQDAPNAPDAIHGMDVDGYTAYVINRNSSATSDLHKVFVYDIRPFIKKMLDIQFNITAQTIRNVRKTLNMKFGIEQVVNKTLNVKFNLEQIVRKTLNVKFDLWHHVPKTLNLKFNMLKTLLPKTINMQFDITSTKVARTLNMKFNLV